MLPNEKNDLIVLKHEIEKIIVNKVKQNVFDIEELLLCKESIYYSHINFSEILKLLP